MGADHNVSRESVPDFSTEVTEITGEGRKEGRVRAGQEPPLLLSGSVTSVSSVVRKLTLIHRPRDAGWFHASRVVPTIVAEARRKQWVLTPGLPCMA
jgi:hypothetical protein